MVAATTPLKRSPDAPLLDGPVAFKSSANLPVPNVVPAGIDLKIIGLGVQYPPNRAYPHHIEEFVAEHYALTPAMQKTLEINRKTMIHGRSVLYPKGHPIHASVSDPPLITSIAEHFLKDSVPLAVSAARKALADAALPAAAITHVVACSCTDASNPGYDVAVCEQLGIRNVPRDLLCGMGCAGGMAVLRVATSMAISARAMGRDATILCVATESVSGLITGELAGIIKTGQVNVGITLFSDCSSAVILSTKAPDQPASPSIPQSPSGWGEGIWSLPGFSLFRRPSWDSVSSSASPSPEDAGAKGVYSIHAFSSYTIPGTSGILRHDINEHGWHVVLSQKLPAVTAAVVGPLFSSLVKAAGLDLTPADMDWACHPGGAAILAAIGESYGLDATDHLRASWGVYQNRGNSSSATIYSVLQTLRGGKQMMEILAADRDAPDAPPPAAKPKAANGAPKRKPVEREWVLAAAFGPGVTVEMALLRRVGWRDSVVPVA